MVLFQAVDRMSAACFLWVKVFLLLGRITGFILLFIGIFNLGYLV
jgi:hypothetical protein